MNAERVDQVFSEPPTVEERLTSLEERVAILEKREIEPAGGESKVDYYPL